MDEVSAAAMVCDGMAVAVGGFINSGHPMAIVRQLARQGRRDLVLVGAASAGLEVDMLIAAGCVRRVVAPYVGAEGLAGIGPAFRHAVQNGIVEIWELDEALYYAGLRAAAQGLPFNPWRAGVGTSLPELNPDLRVFRDPIRGEPMLAVPAVEIDVALIHAAVGDRHGNVQHNGTGYGDRPIHAAAKVSLVVVERLVSTERIRQDPRATSIADADGVVRAPFGCHPFASDGNYPPDKEHITEYLAAARRLLHGDDRSALDDYVRHYFLEPEDHAAYLERVGIRRLIALSEY
jgi:glutaconate CoA-transferase subunit A